MVVAAPLLTSPFLPMPPMSMPPMSMPPIPSSEVEAAVEVDMAAAQVGL